MSLVEMLALAGIVLVLVLWPNARRAAEIGRLRVRLPSANANKMGPSVLFENARDHGQSQIPLLNGLR
jgi:hypothetical protein